MKFLFFLFLLFNSFLISQEWRSYEILEGNCRISFPSPPNHIQSFMPINTHERIQYDIYLSQSEQEDFYLLMVATFPRKLSQDEVQTTIDGFLQGMFYQKDPKRIEVLSDSHIRGYDIAIGESRQGFQGRVLVEGQYLYFLGYQGDNNLSFYINSFYKD